VIFYKYHKRQSGGFTLIEAIVGIAVLGIGVASTVGALTRFNALAATTRNSTGAYTVVINQIDLFQSMSPFNPQKTNDDGTVQIPKYVEAAGNNSGWTVNNPSSLPSYDMTIGAHTIGYVTRDTATSTVTVDN
jgi:prepilin-type N-terminal cleavage/methylation domain-containing protein